MNSTELLMCLELGLIYAIVAMAIFLTFRIIDFPDLTCDGSFVLGGAVSAVCIQSGCNPYVSLIYAVVAGSLSGLGTGMLFAYFKVADLLAGILVAFMLYSINLKVMQGLPNIVLLQEKTIFTGNNSLVVLSMICICVWGVASYLLSTNFGLALRSLGKNKRLSELAGVNIISGTLFGLASSNALIALGGALFSQHQGFADVSQGIGTIIVGLAAVMIGEKLFPSRSPARMLFACIIGSVLYRIFISLALHSNVLGLQSQDLNLITGALIVAVMFVPRRKLC